MVCAAFARDIGKETHTHNASAHTHTLRCMSSILGLLVQAVVFVLAAFGAREVQDVPGTRSHKQQLGWLLNREV